MSPPSLSRRVAWVAAGLAVALALVGCRREEAMRPTTPTPAEARYLAATDPDQLWVGASWDGMEAAAIAAGAPAERKGNDLILRFSKAGPMTLANNDEACEQDDNERCGRYALLFDLPTLGVMLVGKEWLDPRDVWVYDRVTGAATGLTTLPKFSPDGRRMFVRQVSADPTQPNDLQIWHRNGDQAALEWSQPIPKVSAPNQPLPVPVKVRITGWQDNVISLELSDQAGHAWPAKISLNAGQWSLEQTPPQGVAVN